MIVEKINLYNYFNKPQAEKQVAELTTYVQDNSYREGKKRPAMLVFAGGGYRHVSAREQEPVVTRFLAQGFNVFSLEYSVQPFGYPTQLLEACMAMAFIRENADKFDIFSDKIAVIGFSAGGHLAGCLGTLYKEQVVKDFLGDKVDLCRPNALVLSYAVLLSDKFAHKGSIDVLKKEEIELIEKLGVNNNVDENTPPAFLWHTGTDPVVPVENSLVFASKLKERGVKFELHVFEEGGHGLSVATCETGAINEPVQKWVELCITWLKKNGFELEY